MMNSIRLLLVTLSLFFGGIQILAGPDYNSTKFRGIYEYSDQDYTYVENESKCDVNFQISNRAGRVTGMFLFGEMFPSIILDYEQLSHSTEPKLASSTHAIEGNLNPEEFTRRFANSFSRSYFNGQYIVTSQNTTKNGQSYHHILIQYSDIKNPENINAREIILMGSKIIGYRDYFIKQNQVGNSVPKLIGQCFSWSGKREKKLNVEQNIHYFVPTGIDRSILNAPIVYHAELSLNQTSQSENHSFNILETVQ